MLRFAASMTVSPSDIRKLSEAVDFACLPIDPLQTVLITPLFIERGSIPLVQNMEAHGRHVIFDSGGYYVQMGRLKYEELYMPLLKTYEKHRWATIYTLPDHVPLSQDTPEVVQSKVRDTITMSSHFFYEMPIELRTRAMPVVQGHSVRQMDACLDAYLQLGVRWIGFGSFGTQGANSEINVATQNAVELARYVIEVAHKHAVKVHLFGLGVPALVAMIKGIGADSFDSASWLKAAGFGQIFLPFMRSYNISYNSNISELQKGITFDQFREWKALTGHRCPYCEDLVELQARKPYRAVHNLIVMSETVAMVNKGEHDHINAIYRAGSPKYRQEGEKWLR
jgi:hypothetical protein